MPHTVSPGLPAFPWRKGRQRLSCWGLWLQGDAGLSQLLAVCLCVFVTGCALSSAPQKLSCRAALTPSWPTTSRTFPGQSWTRYGWHVPALPWAPAADLGPWPAPRPSQPAPSLLLAFCCGGSSSAALWRKGLPMGREYRRMHLCGTHSERAAGRGYAAGLRVLGQNTIVNVPH